MPITTGAVLDRPAPPTTAGSRIRRTALAVLLLALAAWAVGRASASGASLPAALDLISDLPWFELLGLGLLWITAVALHSVALSAALPGLRHRRAMSLNLAGCAVSAVLPLGGLAGVALNLAMARSWGHRRLDFARFVVVAKTCDVIGKLVMPAVALAALLATGVLAPSAAGAWAPPVAVAFLAAALLLWALCGRATPLLRLVGLAARAASRPAGRPVGTTWPATVSELLTGADVLVRRRRAALALGTAGYWLAHAALMWCCLLAVGRRPLPAAVVLAGLVAERALTLVAVTPGGTGPAEAGAVTVLIGLGVDPTGALAGVLLFRAFVLVAAIPTGAVVGLGWWTAHRRRLRATGERAAPIFPRAHRLAGPPRPGS
ncbi:flippase-like domain-containing protein [Actinoplanes sp. KI2]|uniref:lysylphosphatidylglycerol synthase transmembrane domain-containing protein n=1 Tax=Actinoplanes sp. KI2 TaxID=2983315 RepID=UPI0021D5A195|nr:flippase-like domain-containing protein [Actinoplanes sp. KI2]MCU7724272.1 flippase-like domain-containing protein [Actinoplanes sp. KI2]